MIYSPHVHLLRYDSGDWHPPFEVEVVTSPAVNAGDVRHKTYGENPDAVEAEIEHVMKERMARVLYLFENQGVRNLILGSFGTGVFQNSVELVAKLWVELLTADGSRFKQSFERVLFAIIDTPTVTKFRDVFGGKEGSGEEGTVPSREQKGARAQVSPRGDEEGSSQVPPRKGGKKEGKTKAPPKGEGEEGEALVSPTGGGDESGKSDAPPKAEGEKGKAQVLSRGRNEKGKAPLSPRDGGEEGEPQEARTDGAEAETHKGEPKL
jgi:hypothetical protein